MSFTLINASIEYKTVIQNLMQFYIYDFSEYLKYDVEENGFFSPYPNLDEYWEKDTNKFPYLIKESDKYVGFVLVKIMNSNARNYFSIAEFFILKKYRLKGIGKAVAFGIFNLHKGGWEVFQKESNKPAQIFWNKVISSYTKGQFKEYTADGKRIQSFEN